MSKDSELYRKLSNWKINEAKRLYENEQWNQLILHIKDEFPIPIRSVCMSQGVQMVEARSSHIRWEEPKDHIGNFNWTCILFAHLALTQNFQITLTRNFQISAGYFAEILKLLTRSDLQKAKSYDFPGKHRYITKYYGVHYGKVTYWLMEDGSYRAPGREDIIYQ